MVMHFAGLARLDDQPDPSTFGLLDQMMMDGTGRQQRADRDAIVRYGPVAQHDKLNAFVDGRFGFRGDSVQRFLQPRFSFAAIERDVDDLAVPAFIVDVFERRDLFVGQDRVIDQQPVAMFGSGGEQVLLGPDVALQRHDHFFADRVDGRVGPLCEELLEVIVQHAWLIAEACECGIVAH